MAEVNPVIKNGFVGAGIPTVAAVGAGEPQGNITYSHDVAGPTLVQPKLIEVAVVVNDTNSDGFGHGGGGPQVTLATHPAAFVPAFDVNTKVKQPLGELAVNVGGNVVPEKAPNKGAAELVPS